MSLVRAYLDWSERASAAERAEAAGVLAELVVRGELAPDERRDGEAALMLALEDPSTRVRRAVALALAGEPQAPRPLILRLARDQADVAAIVLANSPVLGDAELSDLLLQAPPLAQRAVASRAHVSTRLSDVVVACCDAPAIMALLANPGAEIAAGAVVRVAERLGGDAAVREALLARPDLPALARYALADAAARELTLFAADRGWLDATRAGRLLRQSMECAAVSVAADAEIDETAELAARALKEGWLTTHLLLRSLFSLDMRFFIAAMAELAEMDRRRVEGLVLSRNLLGFGALYRKAGLPRALEPAFAAAIAAWQELPEGVRGAPGRLSRALVETVASAVALLQGPEAEQLRVALAWLQAEAARADAQDRIAAIRAVPATQAEAAAPAALSPQLALAAPAEATAEPLIQAQDDLEARLAQALDEELRAAA